MAQISNPELVRNLLPDFHSRKDLALNQAHAISFIQNISGLVGFWPAGIRDLSGFGLNMTRISSPVTIAYDNNIVPYVDYVRATPSYLQHADNTNFDITGAEAHVASGSKGLTMGGWWQVSSPGNNEGLISKWPSPNQSYRFYKDTSERLIITLSSDGTSDSTTHTSVLTVPQDTWFYAIAWWNPSTETRIYYALATDNDVTMESDATGVTATIFSGTALLYLGSIGASNFSDGRSSMTFLVRGRLPEIYIETIFDLTSPLFAAT